MAERMSYVALVSGWIAGRRMEAGDRLEMTAAEAAYEHVAPAEVAAPVPARTRKTRSAE